MTLALAVSIFLCVALTALAISRTSQLEKIRVKREEERDASSDLS